MGEYISNGPVSTMPGSRSPSDGQEPCENHEDRSSSMRVQGETDSFGCEYYYLCQECLDAPTKPELMYCDWCKAERDDCNSFRDFEEGMSGPVYKVCLACRVRHNERLADY